MLAAFEKFLESKGFSLSEKGFGGESFGFGCFLVTTLQIWWNLHQHKSADLYLGGGFKHFLFSPLFGEDSNFDSYFSKGLETPTRQGCRFVPYIYIFGKNPPQMVPMDLNIGETRVWL